MSIDPYRMASRFIGVREVPGSVDNAQIVAMLQLDNTWPVEDEVPWCSAFVNYSCWLADYQRTKSLAARAWLKVGEAVRLEDAKPGCDVVILSRGSNPASGHVGFFDRIDGGQIYLLGGNQGDSVSIAPFDIRRVLGVRRLSPNG